MSITKRTRIGIITATVVAIGSFVAVGLATASTAASVDTKSARQAYELNAAAQHGTAPKHKVGPVGSTTEAKSGPDTYTAGIIDMHQGPFSPSLFTVRNIYRGHVGNRWLFVFAGTSNNVDGTHTAGLQIFAQPDGGSYTRVGTFNAPANNGALKVTSVKGSVLTLTADNGATVTFNLASLSYK
jgi:hypothetical protein